MHIVNKTHAIHIGSAEGQKLDITIPQCDTLALGIQDVYVTTADEAQKAVTKLDQAIERMVNMRATIGAQVNRLEFTMQNLSTTKQNLITAESRIRDLDIAEESAVFASKQILVNAGVAMLAQANTLPQVALQLIQGR
jgi:flagellin